MNKKECRTCKHFRKYVDCQGDDWALGTCSCHNSEVSLYIVPESRGACRFYVGTPLPGYPDLGQAPAKEASEGPGKYLGTPERV